MKRFSFFMLFITFLTVIRGCIIEDTFTELKLIGMYINDDETIDGIANINVNETASCTLILQSDDNVTFDKLTILDNGDLKVYDASSEENKILSFESEYDKLEKTYIYRITIELAASTTYGYRNIVVEEIKFFYKKATVKADMNYLNNVRTIRIKSDNSSRLNFIGYTDYILEHGTKIEYPAIEGYDIIWYLDEDCTIESNLTTVPDQDITLYSKELTPLSYKPYMDGWKVTNVSETLKLVYIPETYQGRNVYMIDRDSFKASYELEYAYIGKNVEYINFNAFKDCYNLQTLVFPQDSMLRSINWGAFANCPYLGRYVFPNGVKIKNNEEHIPLNRIGFNGNGMTIRIKVASKQQHDPSDPNYTGPFQIQKYAHLIAVENAYNINIEYVEYTEDELWGTDCAQAIENGYILGERIGEIYEIRSEWIPKLAKAHAIAPLYNPYSDQGYFKKFGYYQDEILMDIAEYKKEVYGYIPGESRPDTFMFFNADLVEKLGLKNPAQMWLDGEWNWSNFVQLLEDAQKSPEWRSNYVQMTGQKTEMLVGAVAARGGRVVLPNNLILWTTEVVLNPLDELIKLYNKGYIDTENYNESTKFNSGNAIFSTGSLNEFGLGEWSTSKKFEIGVVPYPVADGDELALQDYLIPIYGSKAFAVANVQNGENGLNSEVLFNILDDLYSRFENPADEINPQEKYWLWLESIFDNERYVDSIISVQDLKYQYFERIFIASMSAGKNGASHYGGDGLYSIVDSIFDGKDAREAFDEVTNIYKNILADIY